MRDESAMWMEKKEEFHPRYMYFVHLFYILYKINEKYYGRLWLRTVYGVVVVGTFYINIYEDEMSFML